MAYVTRVRVISPDQETPPFFLPLNPNGGATINLKIHIYTTSRALEMLPPVFLGFGPIWPYMVICL